MKFFFHVNWNDEHDRQRRRKYETLMSLISQQSRTNENFASFRIRDLIKMEIFVQCLTRMLHERGKLS